MKSSFIHKYLNHTFVSYLNLNYLNTPIIRIPNVNVLLEYFVISVNSNRENDCFIRVIELSSVYNTYQWASVIQTISFI